MKLSRITALFMLLVCASCAGTDRFWDEENHYRCKRADPGSLDLPEPYDRLVVVRSVVVSSPGEIGDGSKGSKDVKPLEFGQGNVEVFDRPLVELLAYTSGLRTVDYAGKGLDEAAVASNHEGAILLQVTLHSPRLGHGNYVWARIAGIAAYMLGLGLPALWIHDADYILEFEARADFYEGGRPPEHIYGEDLRRSVSKERLNFREKANWWKWLLLPVWPPSGFSPDEEAVTRSLLPRAIGRKGGPLERIKKAVIALARRKPEIRLNLPEEEAINFVIRKPRGGEPAGESCDIDLDLRFELGSSDLEYVRINNELFGPYAYEELIPINEKTLPVQKVVPFDGRKISISVGLRSQEEPVTATIWKVGGK